eukprot:2114712-Pyramimonas_sp.AAC.1
MMFASPGPPERALCTIHGRLEGLVGRLEAILGRLEANVARPEEILGRRRGIWGSGARICSMLPGSVSILAQARGRATAGSRPRIGLLAPGRS